MNPRCGMVVFLFLVISLSAVSAETLCSYKGPDTSEHYLKLTDYYTTGSTSLYEGNSVTAEFKLTYVGKTSVTFDEKYGVFIKAIDPDGKTRYFGNNYQGKTLKNGQYAAVKTEIKLDKAGSWKLYPAYCISGKIAKCSGEWHTCSLTVFVKCSGGCECLTEEEAKEKFSCPVKCGEEVCGYTSSLAAAPSPKYCYKEGCIECPKECKCLTEEEAKKYGYEYCNNEKTLCGYDKYQNPQYCFEAVKTTPTPTPTVKECSSDCTCLTEEEAKKYGYSYCNGEKTICGYDNYQNPQYCYEVSKTTSTPTPTPTPTKTPTPTPTPTIKECSSDCTCLTEEEAKKYGYSYCNGEKTICGYDNYQNPKYCYERGEKLNIKIEPTVIKKGEKFSVSLSTEESFTSLIVLVNGAKVKECSKSPCEFEGTAEEDEPDVGGMLLDESGFIYSAGVLPWEEREACYDSDDGIKPYEPGYAVNESAVREGDTIILPPRYYDTCINDSAIIEYYCDGDEVKSVIRQCSRCYASPEMVLPGGSTMEVTGDFCPCGDSDNGRNFFERGYTSTSEGVMSDYCIDEHTLMEYFCNAENEPDSITVRCEYTREYSGGSYVRDLECIDGRCVCEDTDGGINYYEKGHVLNTTGARYRDECTGEGYHGRLLEYYVDIEPLLYDPDYTDSNQIFRCVVKNVIHECEGDCRDGECVPSCFDGVQNGDEEGVDCGGSCIPCNIGRTYPCVVRNLPNSFDWRDYGLFPRIRDQAACGSCWAFSALGAMEARYNLERIFNSSPPDLTIDISEQYAVSNCIPGSCKGGWPHNVFSHAKSTGIVEERCFPYQSQSCLSSGSCTAACSCSGNCSSPCSCNAKCSDWRSRLWTLGNYHRVPNDIEEIKKALYCYGPLSVCTDNWDHCVVLVGYNDTTGNWIIRNSWGSGWRDNGYGEIPYTGHLYSDLKDYVYYVVGVNSP